MTSLIHEAGEQIAEQTATDVLIIEDEPLISMDLEALVKARPPRLGHRSTHREALAEVNKKRPGLVLADIHLADGSSGLEAVNEMLLSFSVPVIFVTAFPERLLTGERPEPTFLITKPFEPNTVRALVRPGAVLWNGRSYSGRKFRYVAVGSKVGCGVLGKILSSASRRRARS